MADTRVAYGYELTGTRLLVISDGDNPALEMAPAKYLPVVKKVTSFENVYTVLDAGQVAALDASGNLVYCNGGKTVGTTVTYATADVGITIDLDDTTSYVAAAGDATTKLAANLPFGFYWYDVFQGTIADLNLNFKPPQDKVAVLCDRFIELPLITAEQYTGANALANGNLVRAYDDGHPVKWVDGTDPVDQIIGRAVRVETIVADSGLKLVKTMPGLNLAGSGTSGRLQHLNKYRKDQPTVLATKKVRLQITLS